jgi:photosystem II stability/assembly factor-like uncharacterized protein
MFRNVICFIAALTFFGFSPNLMHGKKRVEKNTNPELRLKWYQKHVELKEKSLLKNLPFQFLGPLNVSGRMTDLEVVTPRGKSYTIYVAGASGGIWKTQNEGITWKPVFEHAASTAIGDIALAPSNQNIIWAGTGEANIFRSSQSGAGVYKSKDAGRTWTHMGLTDTNTIARIVIHPKNPQIVYVAASGHEWTNNVNRGVYKTVDGGKTWKKIKYIDSKTGAIDLIINPENPEILYAAFWQRIRKKWNDPRNDKSYTSSGIFKTEDGGKTWKAINKGLPQVIYRGRIGIDLCKTKPDTLYAFVDNYEIMGKWNEGVKDSYGRPKGGKIRGATVYRSDNSGGEWKQVSSTNDYMANLSSTYGWVFGQIRVDPNDENTIYVMGLALNVSRDGGKTFKRIGNMHGDHHGLFVDPANSSYLVNVNDGGVAISYDGGEKWRTFYDNLPLVQFFNVNYDLAYPFHVYGSIQDHGSRRGIVDLSRGRHGIPAVDWEYSPGGEGCSHACDPQNPDIVYSAEFYGTLTRTSMKTKKSKTIVPRPAKGETAYRGQWVAPFIISPHNNNVIYHGMNYLFKSTDSGETWCRISKDLSYNDSKKMGDIPYQTIFSISESPMKQGLIYAGTDDGRLHVTRNDGKKWELITRGLAYRKWIAQVTASKFVEGRVYVAQNGKREDDFKAYLFKSSDYGRKWVDITANIPCGPINSIIEDPKNENVLYVGSDYGVYVTLNQGKTWQLLSRNFPTTYVHDLVIQPKEDILIAATHGRGMYAMDIRFIQQLTDEVLSKNFYSFKIPVAKLPRRRWWRYFGGIKANIGFYLKKQESVLVTIKAANDTLVRTFKIEGDRGLNFILWDLKKDKKDSKNLYAAPGLYKIVFKIGKDTYTEELTVKK